ncbi:MAG: hypothetical protein GY859_33050, partial [Desulfobacterales bacterium]|nr:hypothetical protein [Desulfobacterales bacterium]
MPYTHFDPILDGLSFTGRWELSDKEADRARETFINALKEAMDILKPFLGALIPFYNAGRRAKKRIHVHSPRRLGRAGGMVFAALDFYNARRLFPSSGADAPTPSGAGDQLREYILQRDRDSRAANAAPLLAWMTVLHDIPEKWLPRALLLDSLQRMIEENEWLRDVDIQIDLKEPFPGGAPWLCDQTFDQWELLKRRIDAGAPCPIRLIGESDAPYDHHPVLAIGYEALGDGLGEILVYDVDSPGKDQSILLDFRGRKLSAEESFPNRRRGPLRGFFCETYTPVRPPAPARRFASIFSRKFFQRLF